MQAPDSFRTHVYPRGFYPSGRTVVPEHGVFVFDDFEHTRAESLSFFVGQFTDVAAHGQFVGELVFRGEPVLVRIEKIAAGIIEFEHGDIIALTQVLDDQVSRPVAVLFLTGEYRFACRLCADHADDHRVDERKHEFSVCQPSRGQDGILHAHECCLTAV